MRKSNAGFSLMELVIGIAIMGIFFSAATLVFYKVGKSIMINRTRSVATNLAQEKIESLKNLSYSRLSSTSQSDFLIFGYDNTYYKPETGLLVGDIPYERRVLIRRVSENVSGALVEVLPDAGDTGIKKITSTVLWQEDGVTRSLSISNMSNDSNRQPLNGTISGTVTDQDTASILSEATVAVVDNINWSAVTDASGNYSINVPTGTYQVKASKDGYFTKTSASLNVSGTTPCSISLKLMATGSVTGYVYINDHVVISKIVSSSQTVSEDDYEWIELYNPTTSQWTVNNNFYIAYVDENSIYHWINPSWSSAPLGTLQVTNSTIDPNHYYLIANTPTVTVGGTTVAADASYTGNAIEDDKKGAVLAYLWTGTTWKVDIVGWAPSAGSAPAYEGAAIKDSNGLDEGKTHIRSSAPGGYYSQPGGNAYDSSNNANDFLKNLNIGASSEYYPKNSSYSAAPISGSPSYGAVITCDDGLSRSTLSYYTTNAAGHAMAYFSLPNVATGTWNVACYNSGAYRQISNVSVLNNGQVLGIPNAATSPIWPAANMNNVILLAPTSSGGAIAGTVKNSGVGVSGIKVEAGVSSTFSGSGGYYSLTLDPGLYNITANPNNLNSNYTSQTVSSSVYQGQITNGINFNITAGGSVGGKVLSSAGDLLPSILVTASNSNGSEVGSALTGSDGKFTISNLPTSGNNYTVEPELDSGESATPSVRTLTVAAGSTKWTDTSGIYSSFTVTSAFGNLQGTVTDGATTINTGVLIIATTSTITSDPPTINDALRTGSVLYYGTVSQSDGSYDLSLRGGYAYNVYAWYSTMSNSIPQTTKKSSLNKTVTAGATTTANFTWP